MPRALFSIPARIGLALLMSTLCATGCTNSKGEEPFGESDPDSQEFDSLCGTLYNGGIRNPINGDDGLPVSILSAESSNVVIVQSAEGTLRIKLHALSDAVSPAQRRAGVALIDSLRGPGVLFPPGRGCAVTLGSEEARLGQVFTQDGENVGEAVVVRGFARADTSDPCNSHEISHCYEALYNRGEE